MRCRVIEVIILPVAPDACTPVRPVRRPHCPAAAPRLPEKDRQNMTKSEFVDHVANKSNLDKKDAAAAVEAALAVIEETLARGGEVSFSGFGKFHVAERGAREGVHPRTGEPIQIAASKVPRFTAGSGLKKAVKA
jgi:DNA-binding protein HU-beta